MTVSRRSAALGSIVSGLGALASSGARASGVSAGGGVLDFGATSAGPHAAKRRVKERQPRKSKVAESLDQRGAGREVINECLVITKLGQDHADSFGLGSVLREWDIDGEFGLTIAPFPCGLLL